MSKQKEKDYGKPVLQVNIVKEEDGDEDYQAVWKFDNILQRWGIVTYLRYLADTIEAGLVEAGEIEKLGDDEDGK